MAHDPPQGELGGEPKARSSDASSGEDSPPGPVQPAWRRRWSKVHSRFARQIALVAVAIGTIAAVGHFLGGMIGWWEAYRITLGEHKDERASATARSPAARTDVQSLVLLPLIDESEKQEGSTRGLGGVAYVNRVRAQNGWLPDRDAAMRKAEQAKERLRGSTRTTSSRCSPGKASRPGAAIRKHLVAVADTMLERFPSHAS